jgi:hypothetical protein
MRLTISINDLLKVKKVAMFHLFFEKTYLALKTLIVINFTVYAT